MDDEGMEDMFNDLITPNVIPQIDLQLAPMIISGHGIRKLWVLKTWAGQSNTTVSLRYGLAESIVGRHTMEDRTTAIASIEAQHTRTSSKSSSKRPSTVSPLAVSPRPHPIAEAPRPPPLGLLGNKALSGSFEFSDDDGGESDEIMGYISSEPVSRITSPVLMDVTATDQHPTKATHTPPTMPTMPPLLPTLESDECASSINSSIGDISSKTSQLDFSFFGVFDGHGGFYAAEVLQTELHTIFEKRLTLNNSEPRPAYVSHDEAETPDDLFVVRSLTEVQR
jgi:hypothetical protein